VPAHCGSKTEASTYTTTRATADSPSEMELPCSSGSRVSQRSTNNSGSQTVVGLAVGASRQLVGEAAGAAGGGAVAVAAWHESTAASKPPPTPFSAISAQLLAGASFDAPLPLATRIVNHPATEWAAVAVKRSVGPNQHGTSGSEAQLAASDSTPAHHLQPPTAATVDADSVFDFLSRQISIDAFGPAVTAAQAAAAAATAESSAAAGDDGAIGRRPPRHVGILQPVASSPELTAAAGTAGSGSLLRRPALMRHAVSMGVLRQRGSNGGNGLLLSMSSSLRPTSSSSLLLQSQLSAGRRSHTAVVPTCMSTCSSSAASLLAAAHSRAVTVQPLTLTTSSGDTSGGDATTPPPTHGSAGLGSGGSTLSLSSLVEGSGCSSTGGAPETAGQASMSLLKQQGSGSRLLRWRRSGSRSSRNNSGRPSSATNSGSASASPAAATASTLDPNSPAGVAERFGVAFLSALEAGDAKWASLPAVAGLFDPEVRLVALDKTMHAGKMAALRRLNGGMEQFVKMMAAYVDPGDANSDDQGGPEGGGGGVGGGEAAAVAAVAVDEVTAVDGSTSEGGVDRLVIDRSGSGSVDADDDEAPPAASTTPPAEEAPAPPAAAPPSTNAYSSAVRKLACKSKPTMEVTFPDPTHRPRSVVVTYAFKFGFRRFGFCDELVVKQGLIVRLKRSRG